ncbi:MAG TPA: caspase family protein [Bryobacteraceae bacterium]
MWRGLAIAMLSMALLAQAPRDLRIEPTASSNPLRDRGTRWAVVVGVSAYEHLPPAAQLHFAHRDAEGFAEFLRSFEGGAIPSDHIRLLTNQQATLSQIRAALHTWLVDSAGPQDIVYLFFAGHAVLDDQNEGYFVAADSDPQNLHATALAFQEVDRSLSQRLKASLVVMVADACHTGRLGWSSYAPDAPSRASESLARIGRSDRSFLKLLASNTNEQSFENEKLDSGHGVFTYTLLEGLRGRADLDGDHVIRASEAIDFASRRVPELTGARQHPRVAGTFDARVPLALAPQSPEPAARGVDVEVSGPAASALYIDNIFRGKIRSAGTLRIEALGPGPHAFSADFPDGAALEGTITLSNLPARVTIQSPASSPLAQLRDRLKAGRIVESNGAWDFYRNQNFSGPSRAAAAALMGGALEELGQACVNDYVQSTAPGLKRVMLQRAVDAYDRLRMLRPDDASIEPRQLFCRGRLQIGEGRFSEAVVTLERSLKLDPRFACAYNAMGVALAGINRMKESRQSFETAAKLTPEWGLPPFQIASQLVAAGEPAKALPYLKQAVAYNPRSVGNRWSLMHLDRILGHAADAIRDGAALIQMDPNYAPAYVELGLAYEAERNFAKAAEAYEAYLLLAPNFSDSAGVRERVSRLRGQR